MTAPNKIRPHLWFDKEARMAAEYYVGVFPNSAVTSVTALGDTPSGDAESVTYELAGQPFMAISAGPYFKVNPSVSFTVHCATAGEVDAVWAKLIDGGQALMPLDTYPFSERFGWVQDRFGVSWQVMLSESPAGDAQKIVPALMFTGHNFGKAAEAIDFYTSTFPNTRRGQVLLHPNTPGSADAGTVMTASFALEGLWFSVMDSGYEHGFNFNESMSFMVRCETQAEIDYYWTHLSADPQAEQCGWLKDKYGLSWQIAPSALDRMMSEGTPAQVARVTQTFLPMKKLDIAELERAYHAAA